MIGLSSIPKQIAQQRADHQPRDATGCGAQLRPRCRGDRRDAGPIDDLRGTRLELARGLEQSPLREKRLTERRRTGLQTTSTPADAEPRTRRPGTRPGRSRGGRRRRRLRTSSRRRRRAWERSRAVNRYHVRRPGKRRPHLDKSCVAGVLVRSRCQTRSAIASVLTRTTSVFRSRSGSPDGAPVLRRRTLTGSARVRRTLTRSRRSVSASKPTALRRSPQERVRRRRRTRNTGAATADPARRRSGARFYGRRELDEDLFIVASLGSPRAPVFRPPGTGCSLGQVPRSGSPPRLSVWGCTPAERRWRSVTRVDARLTATSDARPRPSTAAGSRSCGSRRRGPLVALLLLLGNPSPHAWANQSDDRLDRLRRRVGADQYQGLAIAERARMHATYYLNSPKIGGDSTT